MLPGQWGVIMAVDCVSRVMAASGLSREEAQEIMYQTKGYGDKATGDMGSWAKAVRDQADEEIAGILAAEAKAAQAKRELAISHQKFAEVRGAVKSEVQAGKRVDKALTDLVFGIEKTSEGVFGQEAGPVLLFLQKHPEMQKLFNKDPEYRKAFVREREAPGSSPDADVRELAALCNQIDEDIRLRINEKGGNIGKLENWGGPHKHDAGKISKRLQAWRQMLMDSLDWGRTAGDWMTKLEQTDPAAALKAKDAFINSVESHILKGKPIGQDVEAMFTPRKARGGRITTALEHERSLVFRDAEAWSNYNAEFGDGSPINAFFNDLARKSDRLAILSTLGPRPEMTLKAVIDAELDELRMIGAGTDKATLKTIEQLRKNNIASGDGPIGRAWKLVSGADRIPENINIARLGSIARQVVSLSKLGGATISGFSDLPIVAMGAKTRLGFSLVEGWAETSRAFWGKIPPELREEMAGLIDVFNDGFRQSLGSRADEGFNIKTALTGATEVFFRLNLLTQWTDNLKSGAVAMVSHALGRVAKKSFNELDEGLAMTLRRSGLDKYWDVIREHMTFEDNAGRAYIVPERANKIPESVMSLEARHDLDMAIHRLFADEVNTLVLTPDARTRNVATLGGTKAGTLGGELARSMFQFKSFPIAFMQKVLMPILAGNPNQSMGSRIGNASLLIAQMTAFGYVAMEAKKLAKGEKPFFMMDNPDWGRVTLAAAIQGGGAGLYGDFLLAESNRFGGGLVESVAGPLLGTVGEIDRLRGLAIGGELKKADVLNTVVNNTPFINLFYTRGLLDYSILNSAREYCSPGYLRRREQRMKKDGREYIFPPSKHHLKTFGK